MGGLYYWSLFVLVSHVIDVPKWLVYTIMGKRVGALCAASLLVKFDRLAS
jgi:hypothetical protein